MTIEEMARVCVERGNYRADACRLREGSDEGVFGVSFRNVQGITTDSYATQLPLSECERLVAVFSDPGSIQALAVGRLEQPAR